MALTGSFTVWPSTEPILLQLPAGYGLLKLSDIRQLICTRMSTLLGISFSPRDISMWLDQVQLSDITWTWTHGQTITILTNHCDVLFERLGSQTNVNWAAVGLTAAAVSAYPAYDGVIGGGSLPISSVFYSPALLSAFSVKPPIFSNKEMSGALSSIKEPATMHRILEILRKCDTSGSAWTAVTEGYPERLLMGASLRKDDMKYNGVQPLLRKMWESAQKKLFVRREEVLKTLHLRPSLTDFKTVSMRGLFRQ